MQRGADFMGEQYPIILNGEKKGKLSVVQEGLNTVFSAQCEDPGRLIRLSVYGEGKEGYLGVMQPENGAARLTKRLTKGALASFPRSIEFAGEAGQALPDKKKSPSAPSAAAPRPQERSSDIVWHPLGDGSLYTVWNDQPYRAIPLAPCGLPLKKSVGTRQIDGINYAVFPLRDGKI